MASRVERDSRGRFRQHVEPAGYTGGSEADTSNPEVLDPNSVEVRFGDPMVDAPRLLELFTQPTTIEHLEGIVLSPYAYIDPSTKEEKVMPATTVDDIRRTYGEGQQRLTLLTAEAPSGLIVGTCTVGKLSPNVAEIMRVVVGENYRGNRIVDKLIRAANALAFREGSGGLDCRLAQAFVIVSVSGYHTAQNAFRRQGYLGKSEREESTRSWSNELKQLVDRNSQPMELQRKNYIRGFREDHIRYFPTPRPAR